MHKGSVNPLPDHQFESEPGVAQTLQVEESLVCVGAVLVQRPGRAVGGGGDAHVMDDGDPHVGVRLEAEYHNGGTDEEHRDDPHTLEWDHLVERRNMQMMKFHMNHVKIFSCRDKIFCNPLVKKGSTTISFVSRHNRIIEFKCGSKCIGERNLCMRR